MKRALHPEETQAGSRGGIEDDAEMDVDDDDEENKADPEDDAIDAADSPTPQEEDATTSGPFLDSFYGLSSAHAADRAAAAHVLLLHCASNVPDAAYALRRLLAGLCSGRAAARQGNAAALASFLKLAVRLDLLKSIREAELPSSGNDDDDDTTQLSDLAFVRHRLRAATDPTPGRKGSEERDAQFGRLFGINSIVRSGILLPSDDDGGGSSSGSDLADSITVTAGLVTDLADLYRSKKWIREPAAHAVCTLLHALYAHEENADAAARILAHVVPHVIVPQWFAPGGGDDIASYTAEQIGIALVVQTHASMQPDAPLLPPPLDQAVLTQEAVPRIAAALSATSVVTQPRTHLVWDALWTYVTESTTDEASPSLLVDWRTTRASCPLSGESVHDLLGALLQHVVVERLLGMDTDGDGGRGKTTHERRALALCLLRNVCGAEFISSVSGRTRLVLEADLLVIVFFTPFLIRRLFLDVICAGTGRQSAQQHMLKPLALEILDQCVRALCESPPAAVGDGGGSLSKRLAVATALLRCEPRFDARTKTATVERLLGLDVANAAVEMDVFTSLWLPHITFLEGRIATAEPIGQANAVSSYDAQGYIDLLFHFGKQLVQMEPGDGLHELKFGAIKRILGFFIAIAFFDCCNVKAEPASASKKKKPDKKRQIATKSSLVVETALTVQKARAGTTSLCPYDMRTVASARFFSLVAEYVAATAHSSSTEKESNILELLSNLHVMQEQLLGAGAKPVASVSVDEMETDKNESSKAIVTQLRIAAQASHGGSDKGAHKRWAIGCALLASTLHLHLLRCGQPDFDRAGDDDPDADDDEAFEEITGLLSDLRHVATLYSQGATEDEDSPLKALAELCATVLSSPLGAGNQSRGASPTLIRDVVKFAWMGGLSLSASDSNGSALSAHVINILLNALGAIDDSAMDGVVDDEEEDDEECSENDEDDSSSIENSETGVFTSAAGVSEIRDQKKSEESEEDADPSDDQVEVEEVEIDANKLQALLEEGSDPDIDEGELEHHEGADAALARLIQLKQNARKAGQLARERTEIARQIRCILLLETLVVGKAETWGPLLRVDLVLQTIVPILDYRKEILTSLSKATDKGSSTGLSEKRALLDRLTALLKTRILKAKVPDMKWTESASAIDISQEYASALIMQAKETEDKVHQSLCSSGLIFILRSIPDSKEKLQTAELYGDAVLEWATKRTTRLDSTLFEGLIHHSPIIAQACLGAALASAASTGRSTFLKSEAFRLLALLYNTKLNANESDLDKRAMDRIIEATAPALASVAASLQDSEMRKTKRVREVLRAAERVISFLASSSRIPAQSKDRLSEIKGLLHKLKTESESPGISSTAETIEHAIDGLISNKPPIGAEEPTVGLETGLALESKQSDSAKLKKKKQKPKKKKK